MINHLVVTEKLWLWFRYWSKIETILLLFQTAFQNKSLEYIITFCNQQFNDLQYRILIRRILIWHFHPCSCSPQCVWSSLLSTVWRRWWLSVAWPNFCFLSISETAESFRRPAEPRFVYVVSFLWSALFLRWITRRTGPSLATRSTPTAPSRRRWRAWRCCTMSLRSGRLLRWCGSNLNRGCDANQHQQRPSDSGSFHIVRCSVLFEFGGNLTGRRQWKLYCLKA